MEEKEKEIQEQKQEPNMEDTIKVIREEYDNKIAQMEKEHKEELAKVRKEEHEKNVQTIRALMSGRKVETSETAPEEEKTFEEQLIEDTRKKLGLKGGN